MFNPSEDQTRIFNFIENDTRSAIIVAVAGSGKTTTIVEAAKRLPPFKSSIFLAFNKNIQTELATRLPINVQAKTFHSHGLAALARSLPSRPKLDGDKVRKILFAELDYRDFELYYKFISRLVSFAKNAGIGRLTPNTPAEWFNLTAHHNLICDGDESDAVQLAQETLLASNSDLHNIDFDDMLYLACLRAVQFDKTNYIFLDEAQDTNAVQRDLLSRMLPEGPNGRLIAVGDPGQAIYGFRGADANALESLRTEFACVELPLSVSYRCAQEVVREAQKTVPMIQPHPEAPIGSVEQFHNYQITDFTPNSVIICRVTFPLVSLAFELIRRGTGCRILGREIGAGLVALVKKMRTTDIDVLSDKLEHYRAREYAKAMSRYQDAVADAVNDRVACVQIFINQLDESARSLEALITKIEALFTDTKAGVVTLCTVHKAKGLEWQTVYILDKPKYMPLRYATQPWQIQQEQNLIYVAITRAKLNLRYIRSGDWKTKSDDLN